MSASWRTHTQVLSPEAAALADPTPMAFAAALRRVLDDPAEATAMVARAKHVADTEYSEDAYFAKARRACHLLFTRKH